MKALEILFLKELANMCDAELRLIRFLPKLAVAATCPELRGVIEKHRRESKEQFSQVEGVFGAFQQKPQPGKCKGLAGLIDEADQALIDYRDTAAINAALVAAFQKIEHYEIAAYGTLRAWADLLGNQHAVEMLEEILDQEKAADRTLTELAAVKNRETLEELEIEAGVAT